MKTEQEQLADLVRQDELEPVVTGDLLAEGLKAQFGSVDPNQMERVTEEIQAHGDIAVGTPIKRVGSKQAVSSEPTRYPAPEKVLVALYDVHDKLIEAFEGCSINSSISDCLTAQINKIGSCIVAMGGKVEAFDPLNYASGLAIPNVVKNAEEVIERTIQCYKLGTVKEAKIKNDGKEILIKFEGVEGNTKYSAIGSIRAKGWTGNEAIDYIYTPRSGKMSVKSFEGGRWVNKSDPDLYTVSWELEEVQLNNPQGSAENVPAKEEQTHIAQNNEKTQDGEDDIGSPIK